MTNKLGNAHQQFFCKNCGWVGCPRVRITPTKICPICEAVLYKIGKLNSEHKE